jgi:hypothetical protein
MLSVKYQFLSLQFSRAHCLSLSSLFMINRHYFRTKIDSYPYYIPVAEFKDPRQRVVVPARHAAHVA